jgi:hypothetical protein
LFCLCAIPAVCADRGLDGIWQSEGYGTIFTIQGSHIEPFEFTTTTCVKGPAMRFIARRRVKNSNGDGFAIRDGDSADQKFVSSGEREIRLERISALPPVCNHLTPNTPAANFEVFARTFAEHYIRLDLQHADWSAVTERASRDITPATSPAQLFEIMKGLLEPFGDEHSGIVAPAIHRDFEGFRPGGYQTTAGKAEQDFRRREMPVIWGVTDRLFVAKPRTFARGAIAYGHIDRNVGYLRVLQMGSDNYEKSLRDLEPALDTIFSDPNLHALVLDLRINFGGGDTFGFAIASRLVPADYVAFTVEARNSPRDRSSFTVPQQIVMHASKRPGFHGPVVELIGPLTQSAGESFTMALMGRTPRVIRIGENTQGVFSTVLPRRLPNGWTIYLSNEIYRTKEGESFEVGGVPPDIAVPVFAANDIAAGRDPALAAALSQFALTSQ